jgi:hypothetical protein
MVASSRSRLLYWNPRDRVIATNEFHNYLAGGEGERRRNEMAPHASARSLAASAERDVPAEAPRAGGRKTDQDDVLWLEVNKSGPSRGPPRSSPTETKNFLWISGNCLPVWHATCIMYVCTYLPRHFDSRNPSNAARSYLSALSHLPNRHLFSG